jgi:hypothetical protein
MCREVESKQWVNPPATIIWFCLVNGMLWGAIPPSRLSTHWFIYLDRWGTSSLKFLILDICADNVQHL